MAHPQTLTRAINYLVINQEFYASLLLEMQLREIEDNAPPKTLAPESPGFSFTMGTDGRSIYYSRKFVDSITIPVCAFALVHEVCHPMWQHLSRVYEHAISPKGWTKKVDSQGRMLLRDPLLWNIAGDHVINLQLQKEGFTLLKGCCADPKFSGMTAEQVYNKLVQEAEKNGQAQSSESVPGLGSDLVEPGSQPGSEADVKALAEEWKDRIVRAATIARSRGKVPASIEGMIREITEPQYPVWLLLQHFVDEVCKSDDSSWYRPHPHFLPQGVILPGPHSDRVSHVSLWYDTSGSVPDQDLSRFHRIAGDIIRNAQPGLLTLGQCDADVHSFAEIRARGDWPSEIKLTGRGGTSFRPPFSYLQEHSIRPSLLIYLTDLEGDFPEIPPQFPVLWVSTTNQTAPFGRTIQLDRGSDE